MAPIYGGGVCISFYSRNRTFGAIKQYALFPELNNVAQKVLNTDNTRKNLSSIVSSQGLYRFSNIFFEKYPEAIKLTGKGTKNKIVSILFDKMPFAFTSEPPSQDGYLKILGRTRAGRIYKFIKSDYVQHNEYTNAYKVFIPEANGSGSIGEVLSTPLIGEPLIGVTDTFICCGPFSTAAEAEAALKYVKTKFARAMLGIKKVTQHNPKSTWELVPLQDFTSASDIDWSKSIPEIDRQLYAKYGLDAREIDFIETKVKAME